MAGPMYTILVVDDDKNICKMIEINLRKEKSYEVLTATSGESCLRQIRENQVDLVLLDIQMPGIDGIETLKKIKEEDPRIQVVMMPAHGTIERAVLSMKLGAYDFLTKPFGTERLMVTVKNALMAGSLKREVEELRSELRGRYRFENIIGQSGAMQEVLRSIERVANSNVTVLISGESGTGKELVARAIHYNSRRKNKPFVAVNCSALPESLLESELFGHEKGAFTGATQRRIGKFEQANGGTILLDEIGTMRLDLQIRLLRVLQERQVQRVGAQQVSELDVRIIAATNEDLKAKVAAGTFREDLFHRLNVFHLHLPALRERQEDVLLLASHFTELYAARYQKQNLKLSAAALRALETYDFPGNIRELENSIEKAVILSEASEISVEDLMLPQKEGNSSGASETLPGLEKEMIVKALQNGHGSIKRAAEELGVSYKTLQYRLKKHRIDKNQFKA